MRAWAVVEAEQPLQEIEAPTPDPTGTQVLVEVSHCGVCHSDVHFWEGVLDLGGPEKTPISAMGLEPPLTLGHEIVGKVVALGPDAEGKGVEIGDRRIVFPWVGCGECERCLAEEDNLCARGAAIGVRQPGGFGSHVIVPHPRHLVDPGDLDPAVAATYACSGLTVYSAIQKLMPMPADKPIVVIGAGGLGLSAVEMLKALGHRNIVSVDVSDAKRRAALNAGASQAIDGSGTPADAAERIKAAADGPVRGVLDLVNSSTTIRTALACLARGGKTVQVGMFGGRLDMPLMTFPGQGITISGNFVGDPKQLREVVALAREGKLQPIPVETRPKSEATRTLQELRDGKITGRVVLEG
jgi:alcohol dehydrogenase/propanol-preferring alcohol dehydrogenase